MKKIWRDDYLMITMHKRVNPKHIAEAFRQNLREWNDGKYIYVFKNEFTNVYKVERYLKKDCCFNGSDWYVPKIIRIYAAEIVARLEVVV